MATFSPHGLAPPLERMLASWNATLARREYLNRTAAILLSEATQRLQRSARHRKQHHRQRDRH